MAQQHPSLRIPFQTIDGLPPRAQYQIRRDFEEVARAFVPSSSGFDAIIDPATATNASTHTYKNISDFTVGENANIIPAHQMVVRVVGRPGTSIVETSNITLNGPVTFVGGGLTTGSPFGTSARPVIDFNGHTVTVAGNNWVSFQQLELTNTGSVIITLVTGNLALYDSLVNAAPAGVNTIVTIGSSILYARNSGFSGNLAHGAVRTYCFDCVQEFPIASSIIGSASQYFIWDGGSFDTGQGGCGITLTSAYYIDTTHDAFLAGSATSNAMTFTLGNASTGYLSVHSDSAAYPNLSVNALAGDAVVDGSFGSVIVGGNTNRVARNLKLSVPGGGGIDITGPCKADLTFSGGGGTAFVKLRGQGNHVSAAMVAASGGTIPLQLIGCTDSAVVMQLAPGGGVAPYAIDAASARCVVVIAGVTDGWAAGTNAGTNCNVITELGAASGTWGTGGSGAQGAMGQSGYDGADGDDGLPGPPGAAGAQGLPGAAIRGKEGEPGEDGLDGMPGSQGALGPQGPPGPPGAQGPPGNDGEDGLDGMPSTSNPQPWAVAWGNQGTKASTAASGTATAGAGIEILDAVLGNYTFTALAGRRYRVVYAGVIINGSVAADQYALNVRDGGAGAPTITSTLLYAKPGATPGTATAGRVNADISFTTTFTTGVHILAVGTIRTAGTGVYTPVGTRELYVEDCGPV